MKDPVQYITDETLLSTRMQNATGFALPPFLLYKTKVTVQSGKEVEGSADLKQRTLSAIAPVNFQVPVTLIVEGSGELKLPVDPVINVTGRTIITRRYVSKSTAGGSIKERWSQDDWTISISGLLTDDDDHTCQYYVNELRKLIEAGRSGMTLQCEYINDMGIKRIAIEDYDFPFTKGMENQNFVLKGYSDAVYELLIP